jgi:hypothetical protein
MITAVLLAAILLTAGSCGWRRVRGNGNLVTANRNETNFNGVKSAGAFDLYITQGDVYEVKIEAEENLMKYIITEVDNGVLKVKVRNRVNLRPKRDMKVYVKAPSYKVLAIAGSGNIVSESPVKLSDRIELSIAGSGDIKVGELDAPEVKTSIAGSGNINIGGQTKTVEYRIAGSGDVKCRELKAENAEVHIAGSGNVWLFASQNLDVHIAGGGDVHYTGNPVNVKQKIAGSGNIIKE